MSAVQNFTKSELLEVAAASLADRRQFMASALAVWSGGRFNISRIAKQLHCDRQTATKLALMQRPPDHLQSYADAVLNIAQACGISQSLVDDILKTAASFEAVTDASGFMAAARDAATDDKSEK